MTSFQDIEWEACLLEPAQDSELERELRKKFRFVPPSIPLFAPCPWLARSLVHGSYRKNQLVHTDLALADLIFLAVSQDNSCRYCYGAQRALLRILGFDEERIRRLEASSFTAEGDPRERLVLDFARRISRSNPPPTESDWEALRKTGFSDDAIKEIVYVAARTAGANRVATLPALPLELGEGIEKRWFVKWLRPLAARFIRSRLYGRGEPAFLPPEQKTGPFAYVALELDGLPIARTLRETLDAAWSSPILTPRAKALVFAVIARGLGSKRSEREATSLLAPHGLDEGQVEEILSHLASPKLEPIEAAIVPFARETIRFRPADIQRRARKLREELTVEQFLELVGVVGLANETCRMSLALCEG